ncbi:hypothetical protein GO495_29725 [Chitinophaga oryziterrae]|uniref:Uncharacterized protein n=1 Tax=Chitinophaga oryziterrae TaxID=1031224 RepID=A0A6N8JKQ0_9BACT|nr:hypothetical protein [Chitinophaga oryziterrae]MVT44808.1 hypothetical protein [Chitinophaga oryziterrae]
MHEYNSGYDDGYYAGKNASRSEKQIADATKATFSLAGYITIILLGILTTCVIFSGSLMVAHLFLKAIGMYRNSGTWEYILWLLGLGYLVTCLLFYIKGIMIIGKVNGNWWWIPLFLLCLFVICIMPTLVFQSMLEYWLGPSKRTGEGGIKFYIVFSWVIAILIGFFIYQRYKLTQDYGWFIAKWAYQLGIKTAKSISNQDTNT